jgi:hypothetical protein
MNFTSYAAATAIALISTTASAEITRGHPTNAMETTDMCDLIEVEDKLFAVPDPLDFKYIMASITSHQTEAITIEGDSDGPPTKCGYPIALITDPPLRRNRFGNLTRWE